MISYAKTLKLKNVDEEFDAIAQKIAQSKLPKGFTDFILYTLSELMANVREHAKAQKVVLRIKLDRRNLFLSIQDNGIGFRSSYLSQKIYPKNDSAAIEFALSGLSTKNPRERGYGLHSIRRLAEAMRGILAIQSGNVSVRIKENTIAFSKLSRSANGVSIQIQTKVQPVDLYKYVE